MEEKDITKTGPVGLKGLAGISEQMRQKRALETKALRDNTIKGNIAGDAMSPAFHTPQHRDVNDPMAQWGESQYDTIVSGMSDINNLEESRYENQSNLDVMGNALAKMLGTAATTIASGIGGAIVGIPTAILEGRWSGLWDNELTLALSEVDEYMEDNYKIYQSKEQQNADWLSATSLTSAHFWGDSVIKNAGFILGAAASGSMFTGGLGLMSRALGLASKASASNTTIGVLGSLFSATGEGAIEAKQTANDIYQLKSSLIEDEYNRLALSYAEEYSKTEDLKLFQTRMEELNILKENALLKLKEDARSAGNWDMALNIPILTLGNFITMSKGFSKSYNNARRMLEALNRTDSDLIHILNPKEMVKEASKRIKEGKSLEDLATSVKKGSKTWAFVKPIISEGSEEMNQAFASAFSGHYRTKKDLDDYWESRNNAGALQDYLGAVAAIGEGFKDSWGDYNQWEQFFVGGLTGAVGMPMPTKVFNQDKTKSKFNPSRYFSWEGGSFQSLKEFNDLLNNATQASNELNSRITDPKFWERINSGVSHSYFQSEMDEAVLDENKKAYKDAEEKQFVQDLEAFVKVGKVEDFKELIRHTTQNLSDEDINNIIERNTITITKELDAEKKKQSLLFSIAGIETQIEEGINNGISTEELESLVNKRDKLKEEIDNIKGEEKKVSLYTDTYGNPKPIEDIREELSNNGKKLLERVDSYIESMNVVNSLTGGKLDTDLEGHLAYLHYISKASTKRAYDIMDAWSLDKDVLETGKIQIKTSESLEEIAKRTGIPKEQIEKEGDIVTIDVSDLNKEGRKSALLNLEFGYNKESSMYNTDKYFKELIRQYGNEDSYLDFYQDMIDMIALNANSKLFQNTLTDYLLDLNKVLEKKKQAEEKNNQEINNSKIDNLSTSELVEAIDSDKVAIDDNFDLSFSDDEMDFLTGKRDDIDDETKTLALRKNKVQNAKDIINVRDRAIEQASNLTEDEQELQDILNILTDASYLSDNPDDLMDLNSEIYNNTDKISITKEIEDEVNKLLEDGRSNEEILEEVQRLKQERLDDIKNILSLVKKNIEEGNDELSDLPKDIEEGKATKIATISDNGSIDPVDLPKAVNGLDNKITDKEETIQTPKLDDSVLNNPESQESYGTKEDTKNYWKPTTTLHTIHRLSDDNKPYYTFIKDALSREAHKILYDFLSDNNVFERINSNQVTKVNKVKFAISKKLTNNLLAKNLKATVILILDEDNNIIGDLVSPLDLELFNSSKGMPLFYTDAVQYYNEHLNDDTTKDLVILPQESSINRRYIGRPLYTAKEDKHSLNAISNNQPFKLAVAMTSGLNARMFMEAGRKKSLGMSLEEALIVSPNDAKAGLPYLLIETSDPNRKYIPIPFIMPTFSNNIKDSTIYKLVQQHLEKLEEALKSDTKTIEWKDKLKDLLVIHDIYIELNNEGVTLRFKVAKTDTTWITINKGPLNLDNILQIMENLDIPIQISRKYINSTYNGLNYNAIIGEIALTNLAIGALHTVNDFFTINPIVDGKQEKADKLKDVDVLDTINKAKHEKSVNFIDTIILPNQSNIDRSKTDKDYYYIKEADGKCHKYERVHRRLPKNSNLPNNPDSPALKNGLAIDTIYRDFFNGKTPVKPDNFSQDTFDAIIEYLKVFKKRLDKEGYKVYANNIVLYHNFNGTRIAGEVDLLVVDKEGNFLIWDMKTSKYSFSNPSFNTIHKDWGQAMSTKDYYTAQLSMYAALFKALYNKEISTTALMPIILDYDNSNVKGVAFEKGIKLPITDVSIYTVDDDYYNDLDDYLADLEGIDTELSELLNGLEELEEQQKDTITPLQDKEENNPPQTNLIPREEAIKILKATKLFKKILKKILESDRLNDKVLSLMALTDTDILETKLEIISAKLDSSMNDEDLNTLFDNTLNNTALYKKDKGEKESKTINKEISRIRRILPQLSKEEAITLVDKIIATEDGFTWGYFKNGMINLYRNATKGTAYHEAFHYVFNTLMSDKEINQAYKQAREIWGDIGIEALEENMAEDFRLYMLNEETFFGRLKNLWRRLKNFINKLRGKEYYLDSLYLNISRGNFSDRKEKIKSISRKKELQQYTEEELNILNNAPRDSKGRLLAPNGKVSNLTEKQYAQVRTKAFKEWFGDWQNDKENSSKVVDENGEPLVVYHGSDAKFNTFRDDVAIYTTDSINTADSYYYSEENVEDELELFEYNNKLEYYNLEREGAEMRMKSLLEEYLELREPINEYDNPFRDSIFFNNDFMFKPFRETDNFLHKMFPDFLNHIWDKNYRKKIIESYVEYEYPRNIVNFFNKNITGQSLLLFVNNKNPLIINGNNSYWDDIIYNNKKWSTRELEIYAKNNGYDSLIINDIVDLGGKQSKIKKLEKSAKVIISYNPNLVKSATHNLGTFSTTDDDIRYRKVNKNDYNTIKLYHSDKLAYNNLNKEQSEYLKEKNISSEEYNNLTLEEKEVLFHCM